MTDAGRAHVRKSKAHARKSEQLTPSAAWYPRADGRGQSPRPQKQSPCQSDQLRPRSGRLQGCAPAKGRGASGRNPRKRISASRTRNRQLRPRSGRLQGCAPAKGRGASGRNPRKRVLLREQETDSCGRAADAFRDVPRPKAGEQAAETRCKRDFCFANKKPTVAAAQRTPSGMCPGQRPGIKRRDSAAADSRFANKKPPVAAAQRTPSGMCPGQRPGIKQRDSAAAESRFANKKTPSGLCPGQRPGSKRQKPVQAGFCFANKKPTVAAAQRTPSGMCPGQRPGIKRRDSAAAESRFAKQAQCSEIRFGGQ